MAPGDLRARVDRALWDLEAAAELMRQEVGPATGPARLVSARWAAARALLLELCDSSPTTASPAAAPAVRFAPEGEGALLGLLARDHGWIRTDSRTLTKYRGRSDG